jgi:hypothetical protein
MAFMQKQVTEKQEWIEVETTAGTFFVARSWIGESPIDAEDLQQYCEGKVLSWEPRIGYGARLSAPGYLDCTEWSVFDTPEEAQAYLDENYPDEEEED